MAYLQKRQKLAVFDLELQNYFLNYSLALLQIDFGIIPASALFFYNYIYILRFIFLFFVFAFATKNKDNKKIK